jgi:NAD(P)-dependent dehydrogenase (short-subunit alcohol dehydrogenase family)
MDTAGGRNALVQGASRGIGLALAGQLCERPDVARVIATARRPDASEGLAALRARHGERLALVSLDVCDEDSIARAAAEVGALAPRVHLLVNCAGVLHDARGLRPEKKLESVDPAALCRSFEVNAVGPLLVAKHFLPRLRHDERAVFASLSARVASIGDNRAGGWYAYRGAKAAQNMFTRTLAIELGRRAPRCIAVALHPGTVDTDLSRPFQRGVAPAKLFSPERAARQLLAVIDSLRPEDSGSFLAFDRKPIPW